VRRWEAERAQTKGLWSAAEWVRQWVAPREPSTVPLKGPMTGHQREERSVVRLVPKTVRYWELPWVVELERERESVSGRKWVAMWEWTKGQRLEPKRERPMVRWREIQMERERAPWWEKGRVHSMEGQKEWKRV
jgi:hypothetical protein